MMEKNFVDIRYGNGSRPLCRFTLAKPININEIGSVYCIDAVLSEDLRRIDVWLVSKENGRVYYNVAKNAIPSGLQQTVSQLVQNAVGLTKEYTKKQRDGYYEPVDVLREELKRIVSEVVRKKVYECGGISQLKRKYKN